MINRKLYTNYYGLYCKSLTQKYYPFQSDNLVTVLSLPISLIFWVVESIEVKIGSIHHNLSINIRHFCSKTTQKYLPNWWIDIPQCTKISQNTYNYRLGTNYDKWHGIDGHMSTALSIDYCTPDPLCYPVIGW